MRLCDWRFLLTSQEDLADELYERSLQVEPSGAGDTSRKSLTGYGGEQ